MSDIVGILLGLAIGGAIGVVVGRLLGRRSGEDEAAQSANDVAALNATLAEVRSRLDAREKEVVSLQNALTSEKTVTADSRARLESAREHFAEQRKQIEEMEKKVKETFAALSAAALDRNNEQFVKLADARMTPLREQLERYETQIKGLEQARATAYGSINERLDALKLNEDQLSRETRLLVSALRQSGAKGKWGEVSLRNLIELTGMSSYCDFNEQAMLETDSSRMRPDMVVRLPGGRSLVIDSKVNASAYLDAMEATEEDQKQRHLTKFAGDVRATMRMLASKEYGRLSDQSAEFVVMFMPGEAFFAAALAQDRGLLEEGMKNRVLLVSPTALAALLMAIRHGWQQQQVAENAQEIARAGRELYDRLCKFTEHLDGIRRGIEGAASAYNNAVGNWESRTLPGAKRLKELDAAAATKEIDELPPVKTVLRPLISAKEDVPRTLI